MFTTRTLLKLFTVLEEELGLNAFEMRGYHYWPAMRFLLSTGLQSNEQSGPPDPRVAEAEAKIEPRYQAIIQARGPAPDAPPADLLARRAHPTTTDGRGILLFSRPEDHYLPTTSGYYAPTLDPWAELAVGRWPWMKAELLSPLFNETLPYRPRTVLTMGLLGTPLSLQDKAELELRDDIIRGSLVPSTRVANWLYEELNISLNDFPTVFGREIGAHWHSKQYYRELIKSVQPKLVLTTCYYYPPTISVVWAARELGVPVVDAQHGGNGLYHAGYTHWRHVPENGYLLLPDYFLVWDSISANNVLRWLPPGTTTHLPLIAGRFGLEHARRAGLGDDITPIGVLTHGGTKTILVTLQTLGPTGLTPMMLEAMSKAPPTWTWLVRGHPMSQTWRKPEVMPEALEAAMKEAGVKRYDARLATGQPLATLLPHIDHHLTGFSGTVQECAAYGIRTTFTHPTVWSFFGNYIEMGVADFASTADEIIASIASEKPFPDLKDKLVMPRDDETALNVLSQFLDA
jgi:hypothetical protein